MQRTIATWYQAGTPTCTWMQHTWVWGGMTAGLLLSESHTWFPLAFLYLVWRFFLASAFEGSFQPTQRIGLFSQLLGCPHVGLLYQN